ncbi:HNH endonuclease, partial [Zavarzinella formosa]|uniref:HNH endonuclease n=1 Tax=Zavarzinella formosa TaxID=360055 RepID=UPI00187D969A
MQEIQLSNSPLKTLVDDDIAELIKGKSLSITNAGYVQFWNKTKPALLHRFVINAQKGQHTDHIDPNKLNNTRENLRIVTRQENQLNRNRSKNSSQYRGVCWSVTEERWLSGASAKYQYTIWHFI